MIITCLKLRLCCVVVGSGACSGAGTGAGCLAFDCLAFGSGFTCLAFGFFCEICCGDDDDDVKINWFGGGSINNGFGGGGMGRFGWGGFGSEGTRGGGIGSDGSRGGGIGKYEGGRWYSSRPLPR